jgi:hypothetical protein
MSRSRSRLAADWFARLRTNLITDEVEHLDLEAEKEATAVALALTMVKANNLSDLANAATARTNLNVHSKSEIIGMMIDEDDMASDSATKVPTQQSVKYYVDNLDFGSL